MVYFTPTILKELKITFLGSMAMSVIRYDNECFNCINAK